ncbi:MAG: aminopeptidase P family N-terminal domain-containing protein, partial [Eubacterium sp.]|nr:aminopeptidase P family N-terminal domain-containing protein [Eubacterium sp.]
MKQEIAKLQKRMTTLGIDAFYIPCGDPHNSEYFPAHYRCAEFFSGLHAEAQELVITKDSAYLWTDGRYFLQADRELAGSDIELMKMGQPDVPSIPEFLADLSGGRADFTLAYDGNIVSAAKGARIAKSVAGHILTDIDPAEGIWTDRPMLEPAGIWELPLSSCGMTASEKIADVRSAMAEAGADILLLSDLMETAWTFNLRGNDIDYTPVFMSYAIITKDICELFVMDEAFEAPAELSFVKERPYSEDTDALSELCSGTPVIRYDPEKVSVSVISAIPENTGRITNPTPVSEMKIIKNATETACTLNAHRKDGAAMVKFIYWLKNKLTDRTSLTEIDAADYLDNCRKSMDGFLDLSFNTISAYGPNGAVIHYAASPETNAEILPEGFLLVDSGAHYIDGTTDITRTIACGPLTDEMKKCYTLVLKSHIALARAELIEDRTDSDI